MSFNVSLKFKKNRDYSNENKNTIIWTLPPAYRVSAADLNSMDKGGSYTISFKNEDVATKFATELFQSSNNVIDVTTSF